MIVEDEPFIQMTLQADLEELGWSALAFDDGRAALAALSAGAPVDLLVTDVSLPGLPGPDLALAVWAQRPDLAVLFTTGHADFDWRGLAAGRRAALLPKPYGGEALRAAIATLL